MKRKYLLPILVIAFTLTLAVPSYPSELTEEFVDNEYGYSIKYPDSWKAGILRSGIVLAEVNSKDNKSGLQIRAMPLRTKIDKFIDDYTNKFINDMKATLLDKREAFVGLDRGYTLSFSSKRGAGEYFLKTYIFPVNNASTVYIFQSGTPYEMKDETEPVLDLIAGSFRLK